MHRNPRSLVLPITLLAALASGTLLLADDEPAEAPRRFVVATPQARFAVEGTRPLDEWIVIETGRTRFEKPGPDDWDTRARIDVEQDSVAEAMARDLDGDGDAEYVVLSATDGSGPFARLQVVEVIPGGFLVTGHDSFGMPRILEDGSIAIGQGVYEGAATRIEYRVFRYRSGGTLVAAGAG